MEWAPKKHWRRDRAKALDMPIIEFLERYYPVFVDFRKTMWQGELAADLGSIENAVKLYLGVWDSAQKERFVSDLSEMLADADLLEELGTAEVMRCARKPGVSGR